MSVVGTRRRDDGDRCARGERYGYFQEVSSHFGYMGDYVPSYKWEKVAVQRSNSNKSRVRSYSRKPTSYYTPVHSDIWGRVPDFVKNAGLYLLKRLI